MLVFTYDERELLDLYEAIASQPDFHPDMQFAPGDIQWLSNHTILHARTADEDHRSPVQAPSAALVALDRRLTERAARRGTRSGAWRVVARRTIALLSRT